MQKNQFFKSLMFAGLSVSLAFAQSTTTPRTADERDQGSTERTNQTPRANETVNRQGQSAEGHAAGAAGTTNRQDAEQQSMVGKSDRQFMTKAASGGLMEVQVAELAMEKSNSEAVKNYARQLKEDHSKANEQLKQIAQQRNVDLPNEPTGDHQKHISRLQNLSGEEFDRAFMKMQVQHHKKDISEFKKEAQRGMDTDLREFASSTLPTLEQHLQTAQQIQGEGTRSRTPARSINQTEDQTGAGHTGHTGAGQTDRSGAGRTDRTGSDQTDRTGRSQSGPTSPEK